MDGREGNEATVARPAVSTGFRAPQAQARQPDAGFRR